MQTVVIIFQLLPAIIAAIKAIEDAIPGQGKGELKLAAIREILEAADDGYGKFWPQISKTVSVLVGIFNKAGVFNK